ncbi:MAG: enoyl-[acyl-carrier-protein] reductase FabK [Chloroflexi bacterium]|nr:MAG: enoyl-[acyl-carrier-protein] reductase FabK [Chloroflexota bacterium]
MLGTPVCDFLGIRCPIIQGGMAYLAGPELVAAVSNAGALGTLGAGYLPPDWVEELISRTRALTDRPFAVNIMPHSPHIEAVLEVVIEEKAPVVALGGGDPTQCLPVLKAGQVKVMPVVSSVAAARRMEQLGADAVVVEGMESGGHIGDVTTMALVPQVVDAVRIPVIAAGGIADGRGLVAALALGAQAVQVGTRFVCTRECAAHPRFKERMLEAGGSDTRVIGRSTGRPVRCLDTELIRQILEMEKGGQTVDHYFGAGKLHTAAVEGNVEDGFVMAGQAVGLVREMMTAEEVVQQMMNEAEMTINALTRRLAS